MNLGYPHHTDERKKPKKVYFNTSDGVADGSVNDLESIRDIKTSDTFTLSLSEDGKVYSWGTGTNGHLGHNNTETLIRPKAIKFDFKDENKKIKALQTKHKNMEGLEDLLSFHRFVKSSNKL